MLIYDSLCNPEMLRWTRADAEKIFAGKSGAAHTLTQEEINALLVARAKAGKQVVRLKGGDPFVFGRGGEEAQALASAGVPFEIVPGVTSAIAAPAYAGIPVTHRDFASTVTFITGHEDPSKTESASMAAAGGASGHEDFPDGSRTVARALPSVSSRRVRSGNARGPGALGHDGLPGKH